MVILMTCWRLSVDYHQMRHCGGQVRGDNHTVTGLPSGTPSAPPKTKSSWVSGRKRRKLSILKYFRIIFIIKACSPRKRWPHPHPPWERATNHPHLAPLSHLRGEKNVSKHLWGGQFWGPKTKKLRCNFTIIEYILSPTLYPHIMRVSVQQWITAQRALKQSCT